MSFKTIAVDSRVYEKLARQKRDSESFTKTIDRLVDNAGLQGTCANAAALVASIVHSPLSEAEVAQLEGVVDSNRRETDWGANSWS